MRQLKYEGGGINKSDFTMLFSVITKEIKMKHLLMVDLLLS